MRVKKILLPFNFTDCAINALRYSAALAQKFEAKLFIMYAFDNDSRNANELKEAYEIKIAAILNKESSLKKVKTDIHVTKKGPKEAIIDATNRFDIDLIVMGTEGVHKPYDELAGSFTYNIIDSSKTPVLTVPEGCQFQPYYTIGFGVDLKKIEHTLTLDILLDFALAFQSKIEIFHVEKFDAKHDKEETYEALKLEDYFSEIEHEFLTMKNKTLKDGVNDYIQERKPDMLAIMPRKYSFFEWLKHDSITQEVVQHVFVPVLTFPDK